MVAALGRDIGAPKPTAESLRVNLELVLIFQGFGEMVVVVLRELRLVQFHDTLAQTSGFGVGGPTTSVTMDDSTGSLSTYSGLEPEDLTHGQPEHCGRVTGRPVREGCLDYSQPDQLILLELQL